jgi:hydroxypyruvate reductase
MNAESSDPAARRDALAIWNAGLAAVRSDRLVQDSVQVNDDMLAFARMPDGLNWRLNELRRIEVVGAGKAGAGMAQGLEQALGSTWLEQADVRGFLNVPADCVDSQGTVPGVQDLSPAHAMMLANNPPSHDEFGALAATASGRIFLHAGRPAGKNEPTEAGVAGSREILRRVETLGPHDLCICLLSGGGSALLPAPPDGMTLDDLLELTRHLSAAGATIEQLNSVRKCLSEIQGGNLARRCGAGWLVTLIISDVLGDPLDLIASGPTFIDQNPAAAAQRALQVAHDFQLERLPSGHRIVALLQQRYCQALSAAASAPKRSGIGVTRNWVIGNNQTAVAAAAAAARDRGYEVEIAPAHSASQTAEEAGRELLDHLRRRLMLTAKKDTPWCFISGGEPIVRLAPSEIRGRGGRNQQLVLAALCEQLEHPIDASNFALLSAGTDGEDGPTDAAGAFLDSTVLRRVAVAPLDPRQHLRRNDAYSLFEETQNLIKTGPTHTNVCDLRVVVLRGHH